MTVKFGTNDKGSPPASWRTPNCTFGRPARRAEVDRVRGMGAQERGRNVTFPARQYSVNGERRSFALLRPIADSTSQNKLRDLILEAYKAHEAQLAATV